MFTNPTLDAWMSAVDAATQGNDDLLPWFADRQALVDATDRVRGFRWDPGSVVIQAGAVENHAVILAAGTAEILDEDGNVVRELEAPATLGTFGFAIGRPRSTTVRATSEAVTLNLGRGELAAIGQQSPTLAIGLLRWLALDIVRWLTQTRGRADVWTREHGLAGADRAFATLPPARGLIPAGSPDDLRARECLAKVALFQGRSTRKLTAGLGEHLNLVRVDAGGGIVSHGDLDRSLLVLLDGQASVRNVDNEVLGRFDSASPQAADRLIGELGFLASTGRDGTVVADTPCLLLEIPHAAADWLVQHDADLGFRVHLALLRTVCWRLDEADADRSRTAAILAGDLDAWLAD